VIDAAESYFLAVVFGGLLAIVFQLWVRQRRSDR
jgi:hypothetical protein